MSTNNEQDNELPDVSSRARKEIQVVVIGATKAGNGPCLIRFDVCCTAGQYANGDHYDAALEHASQLGYEPPMTAIDENDPAWKDIVPATDNTTLYRTSIYHQPLDPTLEEMYTALELQMPGGPNVSEETVQAWRVDHYSEFAAIYWYANLNHSGQASNLYSVLSTSPYTPGNMMQGPESEGELCVEAYNKLVDAFGGDYVELDLEIHEDDHADEDTDLESTPIITARHHAALEGILKILRPVADAVKVSTGKPEAHDASQTQRYIIETSEHATPSYLVDWLMTQNQWKWSNRKQDAFKFQDPTTIRVILKQLRAAGFKVITTPVQDESTDG